MFERIVPLENEKVFAELKNILFRNNCQIINEEHPRQITILQGSLWGATPRGVKKKIEYYLYPHELGTRVVTKTSLTSDWINLSVLGYFIVLILTAVTLWIAIDLEAAIAANRDTFWGWLREAFGYSGYQRTSVLINALRVLAVFPVVLVVAGIIIDVYIFGKRDSFAEETLRILP